MKRNLKQFHKLESGTRQDCSLSPYRFNIVLEVLARAVIQIKDIKGMQIGKEEVQVSLFADYMVAYISDPKNSTRERLHLITPSAKWLDTELTQTKKHTKKQ